MEGITKSLVGNTGIWLLVLLLLVAGLICAFAFTLNKLSAFQREWKALLKGSDGQSLESLLGDHLRERTQLAERVAEAERKLDTHDKRLGTSKRFMGLVRFDAFEEVGGAQSFALAVYDERGDGVVLSSLVGRSDCRVYCKNLVGGKSERELSREELESIEVAGKSAMRPSVRK